MLKYNPPVFTKQLLLLALLFCLLLLAIFLWYDIELKKIDLQKSARQHATIYHPSNPFI